MVHVPQTLTEEASVRQSGRGEGRPGTRSGRTSRTPGSNECLEEEIPVVPTPEERRLSRIGKAELPNEEQVYDPVFSGHARTMGIRSTRTMNAPDERKDEEGGGDPGKNAGECGLGGAGGGATSPQVNPILKGAKRKGKTVETKARLLELLG